VAWEEGSHSPKWIDSVSWDNKEVAVDISRETIKTAPEYTDESLFTRDYETGLYGHYNREDTGSRNSLQSKGTSAKG